jgi:predicted  nucleic acid-binding Zn-ribbon protein
MMSLSNCITCGEQYDAQGVTRLECFRCHVRGIRLGFTYGKADFHGDTVRERQKAHESEMKAKGIDFAPVGRTWV